MQWRIIFLSLRFSMTCLSLIPRSSVVNRVDLISMTVVCTYVKCVQSEIPEQDHTYEFIFNLLLKEF